MISLLSNSNPNVIELLGLKKEHYLYLNEIGQELIDNADKFVGDPDMLTDLDIWLNVPVSSISDSMPTIQVTKDYCSKNTINYLMVNGSLKTLSECLEDN